MQDTTVTEALTITKHWPNPTPQQQLIMIIGWACTYVRIRGWVVSIDLSQM